ncbi:poly-gamma-glutamate biosynthesis protein PgsC/CapC [candidate division KSB1 bacterium]
MTTIGYEISFIGLLVTLGFISLLRIIPGGIIVPSYLVLFLDQPERIAGILIASLLTFVCYRIASRFMLIFGSRKFVFMFLIGGLWAILCLRLFPLIFPVSPEFRVIGWVIPGFIANNMDSQGVTVTTASLITVTVVTYFIGMVLNFIM